MLRPAARARTHAARPEVAPLELPAPGDTDPIGAPVRIKDVPFRVVGVLSFKGGTGFGGDQDDTVLIPLGAAQRKLIGITYVHWIVVSATGASQVNDAVQQITELLRQRHRIRAGDNDDFFIRTQLEAANTAEQTSCVMTLLLAASATISSIARWPTMVDPGAVFLAFGFASVVGLFFGFCPARRASTLDPIDALRYE